MEPAKEIDEDRKETGRLVFLYSNICTPANCITWSRLMYQTSNQWKTQWAIMQAMQVNPIVPREIEENCL